MLSDERSEFEAIEVRHADVDQGQSDVGREKAAECLLAGARLDQIFAEVSQDCLIGQELCGLIVDE
jgi:hypothetical protein